MRLINKISATTAFTVALIFELSAQNLPSSVTQRIDSLFSQWNNRNSPGCAIGIVRNDSLVYANAYGSANLEYQIPLTETSLFNIASLSKQFTGYAIAMLVNKGLVDLDKDVRSYLPWVPNLKAKITVKDLLHHTSGLRDHLAMALWGGIGYDGLITQDYAKKYISHYKDLNFPPGENHSYSNSNYVLLAEIIKTISGKSFKDYMDSAVFKPLGMKHSFFIDQPSALIKNKTESYRSIGNAQYANVFQNVFTNGDGGIYSNIVDLAKWVGNFQHQKLGTADDMALFLSSGKLNDSTLLNYAMGIGDLTHKGFRQLTHGGGLAGYRTRITVYPELKLGFIVLSNLSNIAAGMKADQLAELFLTEHSKVTKAVAPQILDTTKSFLGDTSRAKELVGTYLADDGLKAECWFTNLKLYWRYYGRPVLLIEKDKDKFAMATDTTVKFHFLNQSGNRTVHQFEYGYKRKFQEYHVDSTLTDKEMMNYTGIYYSSELDLRIEITKNNKGLLLKSFKHGESLIKPLTKNDFFNQTGGTYFNFLRNAKKEIIGFEVSTGPLFHLRFDKLLGLKNKE
ncbi:MAG TPA: serine hydrolase domain-containing protein [Chitinophagaceae bacterium]|nr:serine hydrolase domain-containing protein [Chitinophagaceae bacterium]